MGCNSCSSITLPGVSGSQGADGTQGPQGPIGNPGPAGASVSVIEIDTSPVTGRTSDYQSTPNKRVSIPADTWENVDDMVELEMMFITAFHGPKSFTHAHLIDADDSVLQHLVVVLSSAGSVCS